MILYVKLTKGIGHKFYQLIKSSPINTINSHSIMIILSMHIIHIEIYCKQGQCKAWRIPSPKN